MVLVEVGQSVVHENVALKWLIKGEGYRTFARHCAIPAEVI
uniref:Uncharacterized protein n=1 Tax=Anguilla anguilla TaxID=7936 RepID=A0A0E9QP57_ANGAN